MKHGCLLGACAVLLAAGALATNVEPVPPPVPPAPLVLITGKALDGSGGELHDARIGIARGKISSLRAAGDANEIDLRGYTVLPGWIDTHVHLELYFDRA